MEFVNIKDKEIARIAKKCGAEVPFMRPKELAKDNAKGIDVVLHAINWFEKGDRQKEYDLIMLLQLTSLLRRFEDIDKAIELLFLQEAKAIVSVYEVDHHPFWANTLPENGCMKNFIRQEIINKNRQELPVFYRLNGAIYLIYCNYLKQCKNFIGKETFAYKMSRERSIDIDSEIDLKLAEVLIKNKI